MKNPPNQIHRLIKKKPKTSLSMSSEIIQEIISQIHDQRETDSETNEDMKVLETECFEEKRLDDQLMDTTPTIKLPIQDQEMKLLETMSFEEKRFEDTLMHNKVKDNQPTNGHTDKKSQDNLKRKREMSQKHLKKGIAVINVKKPESFRQIPQNLKRNFPKDHVILPIKPDGLCGISCGASHIFGEPSEGLQFRRKINMHLVSHWPYYKDKIEFPYERQVGVSGEYAKFSDPFELQNFLQTPAADLLWTDAEEILAMANMFSMKVTVIKVIEGEKDPVISKVGPDQDILKLGLPNTVQIGPGTVPEMFMLLRGAHYDLAVPRESVEDKYVYREITDEDESDGSQQDDEDMEEGEEGEDTKMIEKTPEQKLDELEEKFTKLNQRYVRCMNENKSLKAEINRIKVQCNTNHNSDGGRDNIEEEETLVKSKSKGYRQTNPQNEAAANFKCTMCDRTFVKGRVLEKHMKTHTQDGDWTCGDLECNFQTNNEDHLNRHKQQVHEPKNQSQIKNNVTERAKSNSTTCHTCERSSFTKLTSTNTSLSHTQPINHVETVRVAHMHPNVGITTKNILRATKCATSVETPSEPCMS